jgi:hypothetical protein
MKLLVRIAEGSRHANWYPKVMLAVANQIKRASLLGNLP